jgi:hypothetical protein
MQDGYLSGMKIFKTVGIVLGGYIVAAISSALIALSGADTTGNSGSGVALITLAIYWGTLAKKVGYRWFDFLFLLIPIYGIIWAFRIANRVASLPEKRWSVVDDQEK